MKPLTVSDSTALIVLGKAGLMELLVKSYEQIVTPPAVRAEVGDTLDGYKTILIQKPADAKKIARLALLLDRGESEAIALALELNAPLLIDERKGRKIALAEGLEIVGVLGLIIRAFRGSQIGRSDALEYLDRLQKAGLYLSPALCEQFERLLECRA